MSRAWAKKDDPDWHSLIAHSADVAAVLRVLLRETKMANRFGTLAGLDLSPVHLDRLAVLAALHDAGKASRGFQEGTAGHLRPIIGLFTEGGEYLDPLPLRRMIPWFQNGAHLRHFLITTWSHHGEPIPKASSQHISAWHPGDDYDPADELARLAQRIEEQWLETAFSGTAAPFPDAPALENAFAGVLTLADWIGSDRRYFRYENGEDENAWNRATSRAEEALDEMGVLHDPPHSGLQTMLGPHDPYEFQSAGTALDGRVVVAEGPTGTGKTELALGRFAELRRAGAVEGMYFGVPTRAAAKQIHERIYRIAQTIFDDPPPVVQAVPGYVKADDEHGIRRGLDVYWDGETSRRNWAAEHSKRYTAAPIAVGTIDQALLAMLETPHAHMRMAGLLNSFLVVDEVHATSTYMAEILKDVVRVHADAGGHALLMSATVQSSTRSAFLGQPSPELDEAVDDTPYPLVISSEDEEAPDVPDRLRKTVELDIRTAEDPDEAFRRAVAAHADAGRVLGIRNTVDGARTVHSALSCNTLRVGGEPVCHHSRYAQPDRDELDEALVDLYGETYKDGNETLATIATQTVEQSLDIDADRMVTDLVPMPVFLQRLGRLWRHPERARPDAFDVATCIVIVPDTDLAEYLDDGTAHGPMGIGTVYEDLRILKVTLDVLRDHDGEEIVIPRDSRELVERSTHREVMSDICDTDAWEEHERYVFGERAADESHADLVGLDWASTRYSKMNFSNADVRSRLGELPHTVELQATTPFGNEISQLDIPAWMLEDEDDNPLNPAPDDAVVTEQADDHFTFDVCGKSFLYDYNGFREDGS
jgi:CRISPR-associated endonuclease/helicase Cas3